MPTIAEDDLHCLIANTLLSSGADKRNADRVADALVSANLCGVDTYGVRGLLGYISSAKEGWIVPTAWPEVITDTPTTALVSGNWTFGHVAAKYALDLAIRKAKEQNVAVVSLVRANHIGRLGEYSEIAASQGMVCQVWASGFGELQPIAVPHGGRVPVCTQIPYRWASPVGRSRRCFSTSRRPRSAGWRLARPR
jgi:LDH2 family malate/lactate/ureidoglycolate dehydrogenase